MIAAAIGLIGVIAGALLTAWLNQRTEKDTRRREARVAAQLIAAELEIAAIKLDSAHDVVEWWPGELSTEQWRAHRTALATELDSELLGELATTYALFEMWMLEQKGASRRELDHELRGALKSNKEKIEYIARRLRRAVPQPSPGPLGRSLAFVAAAVAVLAIAALSYALLVPRVETTNASVAAALEQELPGDETTSCSHDADLWHCKVSYPASGGGCRIARAELGGTALLVQQPSEEGAPQSCSPPRSTSPPTAYVVGTGDEGLVATPQVNKAIREALSKKLRSPPLPQELEPEKESLLARGWKKIKGE